MTGLRLGLGIAWAYLVLGELTGVPNGLGAAIMDARMIGRTDIIFVGIKNLHQGGLQFHWHGSISFKGRAFLLSDEEFCLDDLKACRRLHLHQSTALKPS